MAENKLEAKSDTITDVIPVMSKITEHKLNRSNFIDWSKTVRVYLWSIEKDNHLTNNPPTDNTKQAWLRDDAHYFYKYEVLLTMR